MPALVWGGQIELYSKYIIVPATILGLISLLPFYYFDNLGGNITINTYYVFTLLTPGIVLGISCCLKFISSQERFLGVCRCFGKYSLEIYLVQVTIMCPIMLFLNKHGYPMLINVFLSFLIVFILSVSMKFVTDKTKLFLKL